MEENIKTYRNPDSKVIIKVIRDQCISAATCVVFAPETFTLDDNGVAIVKEGTWNEADTIIKAAKSCPVSAVVIEDLEGNQLYPEK